MCGVGHGWKETLEFSVLLAQFCCESETALKNVINFLLKLSAYTCNMDESQNTYAEWQNRDKKE